MDKKILILRGVPGSGKSYFALEMVNQGWKRINKDEIRQMVNSYSMDRADENMINKIQTTILHTMMKFGHNIVIDNTHARQQYVTDLIEVIDSLKVMTGNEYEVEIKTFDTPLEVCLERNSKREKPVPEEVILNMHKQLFN